MNLLKGVLFSIAMAATTAHAATFVYVSNAEDGNIGMYTLQNDGTLKPGAKFDAGGKNVMPMSVSPDKRFLVRGGALEAVHGGHVRASTARAAR